MRILWPAVAALVIAGPSLAAVTAEDASQLGKTLTPCGAEVAASADGAIPAYTGGLTTAPPGYKAGTGKWVDPFPNDKPLYSITAQNYQQYADKLTEGSKELFKRNPGYRMDVYPTRRSVAVGKYAEESCIKNAKAAKLANNGLTVVDAKGIDPVVLLGIPSRGVPLAERIAERIAAVEGTTVAHGSLDVTMYRDDLRLKPARTLLPTQIPEGDRGIQPAVPDPEVVEQAQGLPGEVPEFGVVPFGLQFRDHDDREHDLVLVEAGQGVRVGQQDAGVENIRAPVGLTALCAGHHGRTYPLG